MADKRITELSELTTYPSSTDMMVVVDVSDTSMASTGTDKKIKYQNIADNYNVKAYGALGDDNTDDTTAIQAAIDAVPSSGGTVFFPPGIYKISSALTLKSHLRLLGGGKNSSNIKQYSTDKDALTGTELTNLTVQSLRVSGPGSGTGRGIALLTSTATNNYISLENLNVRSFGGDGVYIAKGIVSSLKDIVSQNHGGHGFNMEDGTSFTLQACYGLSCTNAGFRLYSLQYSTLISCATDSCGTGYYLDTCQTTALVGCGCESTVNNSVTYNGTAYVLTAGGTNGLYNCENYANLGIAVLVTASSTKNSIVGFLELSPTVSATVSIQVDNGSSAFIQGGSLTTATNYIGSIISMVTGTRSDFTVSGNNIGLKLTQTSGSGTNTQPALQAQSVDVSNRAFATLLASDSTNRWVVAADGKTEWGSGSATRDTNLYRSAADTLKTDDTLIIGTPGTAANSAATIDGTQSLTNKDLTSGTNTFRTLNQDTSGTAANLSGTPALPSGTTATTQAVNSNDTKLATNAYVDRNAISPAVIIFRDDFTNAAASSVTTATSASFGEQLWAAAQISAGTQTTANQTGSFTNPGQLLITTSATSGQGMALYRGSSAKAPYGALGSNAGWEANFVVQLASTANVAFRVGFCLEGQNVADSPTNGIYVEYDTANTGNSDTKFTWVTRSSSSSTYGTTNSINADTSFHRFRIRSTSAGTIAFSIDGGTEYTTSSTVPTGNMMLFLQAITRTSSAKTLAVDLVTYMATTGRA